MKVLYKCDEDSTLCLASFMSIYRSGLETHILVNQNSERVCYSMSDTDYVKLLTSANNYVDFSQYSFISELIND